MAAGISVLSDLSYSMSGACSGAICLEMETANTRVPTAKYTKMGETLRHVIPGHMQCSMACGGKTCKYENPSRWSDEEQAIKGIYSSWITGSLLAMARPSTETIQTYNVIEQFQRCGVKTVINLQRPGEHASCGNPLEQESGFTYRPETFMEAGIYYYNFGWKDYGVASLTTILDMVKVMSFAAQEGKLAVHCHAGLGRTGVLLACYLVFTCRMTADQAILFVRAKRPNSIQTRGQLLCVREFFQFLVPLRNVFSCAEPKACAVTLSQYLNRQRHLLHGYEARQMKNVPKIVQLVCKLLIDIAANRHEKIPEEWLEITDLTTEVEKTISLQGLQQLGKEMRKKGIYAPLCSSHSSFPPSLQSKTLDDQPLSSYNEHEPLWRQQNVESRCSLSNKGSLSYSDSLLYKLEPQLYCLENLKSSKPNKCHIKHSLSLSNLTAWDLPWFSAQNNVSNIPVLDASKEEKQETLCNVFEKPQHVGHQLFSSQSSDQGRKTNCNDVFLASSTNFTLVANEEHLAEDISVGEVNKMGGTNASFISLQSNLSADSRCLLVAKALAMDLTDKDLASKIRRWQTELNSKEGAWDRLRMERDPLVLSSLMWSWLEQLKDPVISSDDIKALTERNVTPLNALHSLEKGHRHTLLCILDCAAHLLPLPKEVEANFLKQTIKVFTKTDPASVMSESLYLTLKACLIPLLHQLHEKAVDDSDVS